MQYQEKDVIFKKLRYNIEQQKEEKNIWCLLGKKGIPSLTFVAALCITYKIPKQIDLLNIPDELKDYIIKLKNDLGQKIIEILRDSKTNEKYQDNIRLFIDKGANLNFQDDNGHTPLSLAALYGRTEIIKILIDKGVDVNIKNMYGCTALMAMLWPWYNNIETAKLLMDNGIDLDIQDNNGYTALMHTIFNGNKEWKPCIEITKLLVDNDADPNIQNKFGETGLMMAVYNGRIEVVRLLIDKCVDVNIKNIYGTDALMMAIEYGNKEILDLFKKEIVDLFTTNSAFICNY